METLQQILNRLKQDHIVVTDFSELSELIQQMLHNRASVQPFAIEKDVLEDIFTLFQSVSLISDNHQVDQIVHSTAEQILSLVKADACSIYSWNELKTTIRMKAFHSIPSWDLKPSRPQTLNVKDFPDIRQVLEEKKAVQASLVAVNSLSFSRDELQRAGVHTVLFLPLVVSQRVIGMVEILDRKPVQAYDERALVLGQILASQAAGRIDQARLLRTFKQRVADLESVFRAGLSLTASLDLKTVLAAILDSVFDLIQGTRHAHIFLFQNGALEFGAALWATSRGRLSGEKLQPNALQYQTARMGRIFVTPDADGPGLISGRSMVSRVSKVCLPLKIETQVVGVMTVSHTRSAVFSRANLRTLQLLGDQAAIAIENAHLHDLLNQQAHTDSLTSLPNRRALDERLGNEVLRASRYQHPFTLGMLDLDCFKQINDTHGHIAGDEALKQVVRRLRANLRDTDFLARYGGDEFAILMPETDLETAESIIDRLAEAVAEDQLTLPGSVQQKLTISVGLAMYPMHAISAQALILAADQALYRSKASIG